MPYELLLTEPRSIRLGPYDDPPVAPEQVRAEAIVSGISHGTELALFRGVSPFDGKRFDADLRLFVDDDQSATYPMRLGYEWVGAVRETGAAVRTPQSGDLVHLARLKLGDTVAVFGLGAFGLLAVQLARVSGAAWIAGVDPIAGRRELARRLGTDAVLDPSAEDAGREIKVAAGRGGVDVAIELSGSYAALHEALRSVRLAGTVVAAGFYTGGAGDDLRLGEEWHHNRLTLVGSMSGWGAPHRDPGWDRRRLRAASLDLLASGRLEVDALVTHRIPFAEAARAYDLIDRRPETTLRVVLTYG